MSIRIPLLTLALTLLPGCNPGDERESSPEPAVSCPEGESLVTGAELDACVRLDQLDVTDDAGVRADSAWGLLTVRFPTQSDAVYLSAGVDGTLRVDGLPLLSSDTGDEQVVSVALGIADTDGTDVTAATLDVSLGAAPGSSRTATLDVPVGSTSTVLSSGVSGTPLELGDPSDEAVGAAPGVIVAGAMGPNPDLPNQECPKNWCVPCAVSNSLMFLAAHHGVTFPEGTTAIDYWAETLGTDDDGTDLGWPATKDARLAELGVKVKTTTTTDPAEALAAVQRNCDVELRGSGHVAAISAMARNEDGSYTVEVKHDIEQGTDGGLRRDGGILRDGTITGITWIRSLYGFTMECPTE